MLFVFLLHGVGLGDNDTFGKKIMNIKCNTNICGGLYATIYSHPCGSAMYHVVSQDT